MATLETKVPKEGTETVSGGRVFQSLIVLGTNDRVEAVVSTAGYPLESEGEDTLILAVISKRTLITHKSSMSSSTRW